MLTRLLYLLSLFVGVSACRQEKLTRSTRMDASAVLKHPQVIAEIRAYIRRNPHPRKGLYYLDAVRKDENTHVKLSSMITKSEVHLSQPWCGFIKFDQEWVLVKTDDCPFLKNIDSLLDRYAASRIYDDTRKRYIIDPQGDTLLVVENFFYDPEVVRIDLHRDTVMAIHRNM
ncbi:hypothetical protein HMJ29_08825 [Hymenobacter taeanensis]|uniref:Lipoprotein n=1 Tax=Hymenobacter taeanensis TaxID=2735321 RepID=A0A6M6BEN3_9BACT|nr:MULTISPECIES: hypothetical protein [Hymenobacter]QJX47031.1 hypothetical protein HMJ29_08825 [Hymenobacter taeanensis]UOQ80909.1 hypothetical protein MUN83_19190 [Hymenobacter sp. 5414T-23]